MPCRSIRSVKPMPISGWVEPVQRDLGEFRLKPIQRKLIVSLPLCPSVQAMFSSLHWKKLSGRNVENQCAKNSTDELGQRRSVALLKSLGVQDLLQFHFMDSPPQVKSIESIVRLLHRSSLGQHDELGVSTVDSRSVGQHGHVDAVGSANGGISSGSSPVANVDHIGGDGLQQWNLGQSLVPFVRTKMSRMWYLSSLSSRSNVPFSALWKCHVCTFF